MNRFDTVESTVAGAVSERDRILAHHRTTVSCPNWAHFHLETTIIFYRLSNRVR